MAIHCRPFPELVGAYNWLPSEPFEFGWATPVGCNNLRCRLCGERVDSAAVPNRAIRRYACRCHHMEVVWRHQLGGEPDDLYHQFTDWLCDGHPTFPLPATLDGVRLAADTDWPAVAATAIGRPPFVPPGVDVTVPWLIRLYRLLGEADRPALHHAVTTLFAADDPQLVRGALDFFLTERDAPGGERIVTTIHDREPWLRSTPDPRVTTASMLDSAAHLLFAHLRFARPGRAVSPAVLDTAKSLLLQGIGLYDAPLAVHNHDPDWVWSHAPELARANQKWAFTLVRASAELPEQRRRSVLRQIAEAAPGAADGIGQR
ncbi:MAG: hypothetical protein ABW215_09655 [Kibdelosporangium sp.]